MCFLLKANSSVIVLRRSWKDTSIHKYFNFAFIIHPLTIKSSRNWTISFRILQIPELPVKRSFLTMIFFNVLSRKHLNRVSCFARYDGVEPLRWKQFVSDHYL